MAIFFKRSDQFKYLDSKHDSEGRVMSVLVSCGSQKLNLVSVYAPNTLLPQKTFLQNLHEYFFYGLRTDNRWRFQLC